jgi:DNA repair exonuclease SbcCD ATPase subunit
VTVKGIVLLFGILLVTASPLEESHGDEIYTWRDEKGRLFIVDDIERVPERYRSRMESLSKRNDGPSGPQDRSYETRQVEERQRKTREYRKKRSTQEALIAQEEERIEDLEQSIEKLEHARDRVIEERNYLMGMTTFPDRGAKAAREKPVDPRPTVAISIYNRKIREAREEIGRRERKIEEYEYIIDRLARDELRN